MATQKFTFTYTTVVEVEVDDSLVDELPYFQENISKNFTELKDIADHIAWNLGVQKFSHVEGLVGLEDKFKLIDVDSEAED